MRIKQLLFCLLALVVSGCGNDVPLSKGVITLLESNQLLSAQFSSRGNVLLVLDFEGQASVFDANNFERVFKLPEEEAFLGTRFAILSDDGSKLILANDNEVAIWSLSEKKRIGKTKFNGVQPIATITAIALSSSNDRLIVGMSDGAINMATISTRLNNRFRPHTRPVTHLHFQDESLYWSASEDGILAQREFASPKPKVEQEFAHRITTLTFDKVREQLFVSDALKTQLIKPIKQPGLSKQLQYMARFMTFRQAYFVSEEHLLFTTSSKNHLSLWDIRTGEEIGTWRTQVNKPSATILAMHTNRKGELLTINSDAMVEAWDLNSLNNM